jgi:hypothetical protein
LGVRASDSLNCAPHPIDDRRAMAR